MRRRREGVMIHVCVGERSSKGKGTTLILVRRFINGWNRIKKLILKYINIWVLMSDNSVDKIA